MGVRSKPMDDLPHYGRLVHGRHFGAQHSTNNSLYILQWVMAIC